MKCCGKNVKLTPTNKIQKCTLAANWSYDKPNNLGIQKYHPLNRAKTAPIDNT